VISIFGLKIVKEKQVNKWCDIKDDYHVVLEEITKLKMQFKNEQELISNLEKKLQGTGAVIYDIKKDKQGNYSYICVKDNRKPFSCDNFQNIYLNGPVDLFVLSAIIHPSNVKGCITDMPHLQARFRTTNVSIESLHSDMVNGNYENKGYATMLVEVLKAIAKKSNCTTITGCLTGTDAETTEKKQKRNGFYSSKGFELSFTDDSQENGSFCMHL